MISEQEFKLIYDSIIWAVRHVERNVADTGLNTLYELLINVEKSDLTTQFYQTYYVSILQDILAVLTDTLHKPGFTTQIGILNKLVGIVERGDIRVPLWGTDGHYPSNSVFVQYHVANLLSGAFPHVSRPQIENIVLGMFTLYKDENKFKIHMRDFLIQLKEFSSTDNSDLFSDEQSNQVKAEMAAHSLVPGLLKQENDERI